MRIIVNTAGASQLHIVLCPTMALRLAEEYGSWLKPVVISNLLFLDVPDASARPTIGELAVIGFLSQLSFDKGVDRYLDLFASLRARGSRIAGIMAGSFENREVQDHVERRLREIGNIEYWGPVYGKKKESFLSSIDLLVFPTRYANEAEPLAVYEAQAAGIPVAASNRGCLAEPGRSGSLFLLDSMASDLGPLIEQIMIWEKDPSSFQRVAQQFRDEFSVLLEQRNADAETFRTLFSGRA
jgi:glycosyltransferase involved in cell wall biosynthesis